MSDRRNSHQSSNLIDLFHKKKNNKEDDKKKKVTSGCKKNDLY